MPKERFSIIPSVYALLLKGDQILLLRRINTGFEDGNYGLVAGHVEADESITAALCREAKEEAGININPNELKFVHFMHRKSSDNRADFFFVAEKWDGEISNNEPDKCDDLSWFPIDLLPSNTIAYVRHAIECYRKQIIYSEWGW